METVLYENGTILTMEQDQPETVEAVLTEDGRILAAGSMAEIEKLLEAGNRSALRKNLKGAVMLPAFIDAHSHITAVAQVLGNAGLRGAESFEDIINRLQAFRKQTDKKPGAWIIGVGYDHNFLKEKRHPDKAVLDQYFPDCPVMVSHASGHMGAVNSLALSALGITESTADPKGGVIGRLPGCMEPSGYLEEAAFSRAGSMVPKPDVDQLVKQMAMAQDLYLSRGITTIQDGITRQPEWELLRRMSEGGQLQADVVSYVDFKDNKELLKESPEYTSGYKNHLRIGGCKIFLDGSPQGRTAWMSRPYEGASDGYCGYPIYQDEEVEQYFETALREGRQLLVHCNGDEAARQMIDACAAAAEKTGIDPALIRPVMIHAQLVRRDQLKRMKELSIMVSFFAAHVYYWGDIHLENFGPDRANLISPAKTAIREQVNMTFHQDSPVIEPNMLETVWCAVNRITKEGRELGPEERITPYEALLAITKGAAVQYGEQEEKGSIKAGKCADFVILAEDPLKVDPLKIKDIEILETIKSGQTLYKKEG